MEKLKNAKYSPCFKCLNKLDNMYMANDIRVDQYKSFFAYFKKNKKFSVGSHGNEKAKIKDINMNDPKERILATNGEVIEVQIGRNDGEIKFIVFNKRDKQPIHYVFLKEAHSDIPLLVNVYNPREGMHFKWSKDGRKRLYLNAFRSCCPHPTDRKENYFKEHHGKNHKLYDYQIKTMADTNVLNQTSASV